MLDFQVQDGLPARRGVSARLNFRVYRLPFSDKLPVRQPELIQLGHYVSVLPGLSIVKCSLHLPLALQYRSVESPRFHLRHRRPCGRGYKALAACLGVHGKNVAQPPALATLAGWLAGWLTGRL